MSSLATSGPDALRTRLFGQSAVWLTLQAGLLFWPARSLAWPAAWVFLVIMAAGSLGIGLWLLRRDPALLAERMRMPLHPGQGGRDAALLAALLVLWCAWCALMGWEARSRGFAGLPDPLQPFGALLLVAGVWGAWAAVAANTYAAITIRLQTERGHSLVDTGAYALVRHPMYGGALLIVLGTPLLLGSVWGLAAVPVFVAALLQRTAWEEKMLTDGLPGYAAYAQRVRYRFLPGVW